MSPSLTSPSPSPLLLVSLYYLLLKVDVINKTQVLCNDGIRGGLETPDLNRPQPTPDTSSAALMGVTPVVHDVRYNMLGEWTLYCL